MLCSWAATLNCTTFADISVGETGDGWDKFWLGQCPSVPNELPDGEINHVFRE